MAKKNSWFIGILLIGMFMVTACSKFDAVNKSISISNTLDSVSANSATVTVVVTVFDKSLPPVKSQGLCLGTSPNPTVDSSQKIIDSTKTSSFHFTITGLTPGTTYYFRGYAINSVGATYGKQISFRTPAISPYTIGQFYAGGLIFYIDSTGNHGLVSDTKDIGDSIVWHIGSIDTLIAGGTAIGTGVTNTANIVGYDTANKTNAAWICKNYTGGGYTDWFLPSKDELSLMRQNLYARGFGNWSSATYWSSSEYLDAQGRYYAWAQYFTNGYPYYFKQYFPLNVRAVRAF